MEKILQKIANILYVNTQNINQTGVLDGLTGITIFFYRYSRFSKIEDYNSFADYLLDIMIENINQMNPLELLSFNWIIEYLIQHNFVEGDSNEVLEDVEKRIPLYYKHTDIDDDSVVFWGLFVLSRIKKGNRSNQQNIKYIKMILKGIEKQLGMKKERSLSYLNSMLFCLLEIHEMHLFDFGKDKIIESKLLPAIINSLSKGNYDPNDLDTLLCFLEEYDMLQKKKLAHLISGKTDLSTQNTIEYIIKRGWQNLLYFKEDKQEKWDMQLAENFIEKILLDPYIDNLTINKGIAGLGMALLNTSQYD